MADAEADSRYVSPQPLDKRRDSPPDLLPVRPLRRAILTVLACAAMFAIAGALLGGLIGSWLPSYYTRARYSDVDRVEIGMALGLSQGFAGGAAVGLAVVLITIWSAAADLKATLSEQLGCDG